MIGCQTAIRGFFRLPCRFPAKPSILPEYRAQVYDPTRFSGAGGSSEIFFTLSFPARQGTEEAALACRLPPLWCRRGRGTGGARAARPWGVAAVADSAPAHKRFGSATGVAEPNRTTSALSDGSDRRHGQHAGIVEESFETLQQRLRGSQRPLDRHAAGAAAIFAVALLAEEPVKDDFERFLLARENGELDCRVGR